MRYLIYTWALLTLMSCEKVIQVDLNDSNPQFVIEAVLEEGEHDFTARITQTTSFFDPKTPKRIGNAVVKLYEDEQVAHTLVYKSDGFYELSNFTAIAGKNYRLNVIVDGKEFNASLTMPNKVPIVSVDYEFVDGEDGFGNQIKVSFNDPPNEKNYYELNTFHDNLGYEAKIGFMTSDFGYDGQLITETLDGLFFSGDTVIIELKSIDVHFYDYFDTLDNALGDGGGPGGAAPANPTTNWTNGALGYFGSGNSYMQTVVVP